VTVSASGDIITVVLVIIELIVVILASRSTTQYPPRIIEPLEFR